MPRMPSYTDEQLRAAVQGSHSWRGVLRALGLSATSAAAIRSIRRRADALDCDYSHFRGQRSWSEDQLRSAVASAGSWQEAADALGLRGGSGVTTIKGHAVRLGIDTMHLTASLTNTPSDTPPSDAPQPSLTHLAASGAILAAGWFALCGYQVSWPLEPCRYDLLVERDGATQRIQVKTTTVRTGRSWTVWLSTSGTQRTPYGVDEIDSFFIIDGDLRYYLIPVAQLGGLHAVQLSAYTDFSLPGVPA